MYIVDFFKRIFRKANIPVIIYLLLNVFIIGLVIAILFGLNFFIALLIGLGLYGVSLVIALSPFGELILRLQTGCKKIKRKDQSDFLNPLFGEVYEKAREYDPSVPDDVRIYINNDEDPNAFATGRKTICVTEGMLNMPEAQIKATLGHEFGHLAHKDTDLILLVSVGNFIVSAIILGIKVIITVISLIFTLCTFFLGGAEGVFARITGGLCHLLITVIVGGLTWLWTKLGILLVMKSSREQEYDADRFAFDLGYGNDLCAMLDAVCAPKTKGLFANLVSSHPDKNDRINRLQEMGASYAAEYGKNDTPHS